MCKPRHEVTLLSAVDELQREYKALNQLYFNGQLEQCIITIQTDASRSAYAWISVNPVWSDKDQKSYREINIVGEFLGCREPCDVIGSLLHEMCHLKNLQDGIQDCSRGGTYHNAAFRDCAEAHGLTVKKTAKYGWAYTEPSEDLKKWVTENCRKGCFRYKRQATYKNGTPKTTTTGADGLPKTSSRGKSNIRRYHCPACGTIVRASRDLTGKLMRVDCSEVFVEG